MKLNPIIKVPIDTKNPTIAKITKLLSIPVGPKTIAIIDIINNVRQGKNHLNNVYVSPGIL